MSRASLALIGSRIVHEPLMVLYSLLAFILHRDLGASALQIACLISLKPVASIASLYWSHWINAGGRSLKQQILWTGFLSRAPFFLLPFLTNVWWIIGVAAFFMVLHRGGMAPYMEAVRRGVDGEERGKLFGRGLAWGYGEGVVLAILMGVLLDGDPSSWRWLFPLVASLGFLGVWMQAQLAEGRGEVAEVKPWRTTWKLLKENRSFRQFQILFMVAALGLMVMMPAFPVYFDDVLGLSFTQLAIAIAVCKGVGFALTGSWWGRLLHRMATFKYLSLIFLLFGGFALALIGGQVYLAYLIYGVAQGGSKIVWHMCGPLFARDGEDSVPYSAGNVVMVGLRGLVGPPIGALLLGISPFLPLLVGLLLFFTTALWSRRIFLVTKAQESLQVKA